MPRVTARSARDERRELAGLEIALAHLNQIDAGVHRVPRLRDQARARRRRRRAGAGQAAPIGDQADHRAGVVGSDTSPDVVRR